MAKHLVSDSLKHCKTFPHLHQIHAHAITTGILALHPCFLLPNILCTISRLAASTHVVASSSMINYAISVFNLISSPTTFCYNTMMRIQNLFSAPASALLLFKDMRRVSVLPDFHTYPFAIKASVSWGTLISGYARMRECQEAIDLFNSLLCSSSGIRPDNIALVSVLSACAQLGDLEQGRAVHDYIIKNKIRMDSFLSTGLVDLYAKCGCIQNAINIFESSSGKNLFTWNALLMGLAVHGQGSACLGYFFRMIKDGVRPDGVSFLGVLVACSHAGLICEARRLFQNMEAIYGVRRELKHYGCMADLFGRAGLIGEALEMIEHMPVRGDIYTWGALLAGCRKHGIVEVAEEAAKQVQKLNSEDAGLYSVMVDIYANSDMWDDVAKTRSSIKTRRIKKNAACSLIKLNGILHEFIAGDDSHPQTDEIHMILSGLVNHQFEASQM